MLLSGEPPATRISELGTQAQGNSLAVLRVETQVFFHQEKGDINLVSDCYIAIETDHRHSGFSHEKERLFSSINDIYSCFMRAKFVKISPITTSYCGDMISIYTYP